MDRTAPPVKKRLRVFVDCTPTTHARNPSGIPRVVRKLAAHCMAHPHPECEFIPVAHAGGSGADTRFRRLDTAALAPQAAAQPGWFGQKAARYRQKVNKYDDPHRISHRIKRFFYGLVLNLLQGAKPATAQSGTVGLEQADAVLLCDAVWTYATGWIVGLDPRVRVVVLAYDMIPVTHPQFCARNNTARFTEYYPPVLRRADAIYSISRYTMQTLRDHGYANAVDYFHLGSDMALTPPPDSVPPEYAAPFGTQPTFLSVSTLEPRKGYDLTLAAFELLWSQGFNGHWVIVGKHGWKCDDLAHRIKTSAHFGTRLFWFDKASDGELAYLYSRCDALIFASAVEGFGLPLVEALKAGLPVLASDIPVFREIASEHVRFFERTPEAIATAVQAFATERPGRVTNYQPLSWADACSQLLNKVSRFLHAG